VYCELPKFTYEKLGFEAIVYIIQFLNPKHKPVRFTKVFKVKAWLAHFVEEDHFMFAKTD
jgi:hypothetical protein